MQPRFVSRLGRNNRRASSTRVQSLRAGRNGVGPTHPPTINSYGITRDVRLRFIATGSPFNGEITYADILDAICMAATSTNLYDVYTAVKVNAVEAWFLPASDVSPGTITVLYDNVDAGSQGDQKVHTDTSMGIQPAHVKAVPAVMSQQAQWQATSAQPAFNLSCPTGTILDLSVSLRNPINGSVQMAQSVGVALTAGTIYYRGLDGNAIASSGLKPLGALSVA